MMPTKAVMNDPNAVPAPAPPPPRRSVMARKPSATVRVNKDVRPRRPKVDTGAAFEQLVRQMFKQRAEMWCKDNMDTMPDKESLGNVVDNLTASWTSALETIVDAATDTYLSTSTEDGEDDVVECPKCDEEFDVPDDADEGDEISCPSCKHKFDLPPAAEDDDEAAGA